MAPIYRFSIAPGLPFAGFAGRRGRRNYRQTKLSGKKVLITYLDSAKEIADLCRFLNVQNVQLHGAIYPNEVQKLREIAPNLLSLKA
jgi:phosphoribosylanthranilate isomerase